MLDDKPDKTKLIQDIMVRITRPVRDISLLPPPNMWQRFWQHRRLRLVVGAFVVVSVLFLFAGALYYGFFKSSPGDIGAYVPREAWLYVEFDIQEDEWQALKEKAPLLAEKINSFLIDRGLNQQLIERSLKIGLVGIYNDEDKMDWVWILKSPDRYSLEPYMTPDTYVKYMGDDIMAFSESISSLKKIGYASAKTNPNNSQTNTLWSGYVSFGNIPREYNSSIALGTVKEILYSYARPSRKIVFSSQITNRGIVSAVGEESRLFDDTQDVWEFALLTDKYDIVMENINIASSMRFLEQVFKKSPVTQFFIGRAKTNMREWYGSGWERIVDLFDANSTLVVDGIKENSDIGSLWKSASIALNVERTFVPYEHDLILFALGNTFARIFPKTVKHELPDGSIGYERVLDTSSYGFDRDEHNVYTMKNPEHEVEIIVRPGKDMYVISNNTELFEDMATDGTKSPSGYCSEYSEKVFLSESAIGYFPVFSDFSSMAVSMDGVKIRICALF